MPSAAWPKRAGLIPKTTTTVEVVVVRDPDAADDYTIFVGGQDQCTGENGTVHVVTHDIDFGACPITGAWTHDQLQGPGEGLSPNAARHARETVLAYADDLPAGDEFVDGGPEARL